MTTEEQLAWHREPEATKSAPVGLGFGDVPMGRGFAPQGFGHATHNYRAPAFENPAAKSGLIFSLVSWIFNPFLIFSIIGMVKSGRGLRRAREIESMGQPVSGRGRATAGIVLGLVSTLLCIGGIAAGVLLAFPHYDRAATEHAIAVNIQQQTGIAATVVCPVAEPVVPNATFECTITGSNGKTAFATVRFVDQLGHYDVSYSDKSAATSTGGN